MTKRFREKPYTLYPRKLSSGRTVYYYQTYKESGKRTSPVSTGIGFTRKRDEVKTRREAEAYCMELFKYNQLIQGDRISLSEWANANNFWDWHRSTYVRSILARSTKDKPGITETFVNRSFQVWRDHIESYHGNKAIQDISPMDCEQLLFRWVSEGASHKSANNWKSIYSTMLGHYEKELKMKNPRADYFNPWKMVSPLAIEKKSYGALTIAEVSKILSKQDIDLTIKRNNVYYYATRTAFMTGLRIGEICGLLTDNIIDVTNMDKHGNEIRLSYIDIKMQYSQALKKRVLVKDKEARQIPISPELRDELSQLTCTPNTYLFSFHPKNEQPITANRLREWLYQRLDQIGLKVDERKSRNITFHSTRRFFNTLLRHGGVSDDTLRRFTGHDSQEMTDHYTDYLPEDLQAISLAQSKLLTGGFNHE